jgi:SAM-dependent methyltransferase
MSYRDDGDSELDFTHSNRQTYDRIARRYADCQVPPSNAEHWLTELEDDFVSGLPDGGVVADLGCGPAYDGLRLAGKGLRVLGIDLSEGMLEVAAEHLNGHLVQADLRALPIASGQLDGIWNVASLLHIPDRDTMTVLSEFKRVLKPSGSLVFVTALGDASRHESVPYASDESRWFVYRSPVTLKHQMVEVGFAIKRAQEVQGSRRWWTVSASSV